MRLQLALNVDDLDAAIAFYSTAFGVDVHKQGRRRGYANFESTLPVVANLHDAGFGVSPEGPQRSGGPAKRVDTASPAAFRRALASTRRR